MHQNRACHAPAQLPPRFYWYGGSRKSPGKIPKWLKRLLADDKKVKDTEEEEQHSTDQEGCDGMDQEEGNNSQAMSTLEKEADVTVSPDKLEGSTATQGHSYSLRPRNKKNRDDPQ